MWYKIEFEMKNAYLSEELVGYLIDMISKTPTNSIALYTTDPVFTIEFYISSQSDNEITSDIIKKYKAKRPDSIDYSRLKPVDCNKFQSKYFNK